VEPARVLVVEDDADVREVIGLALRRDGVETADAPDGGTARALLAEEHFDLVVLDLALPDVAGLDLLTEIKELVDTPVIIVSARGSEGDRVMGLRGGADDYVVKPFSPRELSARVEAVLRRERRGAPAALVVGDLVVDRVGRTCRVAGVGVDLTAREFDLLAYLASRKGELVTRDDIAEAVWSEDPASVPDGTITEFVRRVRQRLGVDPMGREWIETVWGRGYRLRAPAVSESA